MFGSRQSSLLSEGVFGVSCFPPQGPQMKRSGCASGQRNGRSQNWQTLRSSRVGHFICRFRVLHAMIRILPGVSVNMWFTSLTQKTAIGCAFRTFDREKLPAVLGIENEIDQDDWVIVVSLRWQSEKWRPVRVVARPASDVEALVHSNLDMAELPRSAIGSPAAQRHDLGSQ